MDLSIADVAELFNVTEETVRRWISDGQIPAYQLKQQLRISPMELEDWLLKHQQQNPIGSDQPQGQRQYSLFRAIHNGSVFESVEGSSKEEIFQNCMIELSHQLDFDAELITELLLDREQLMPTALNHGIAVPHTRDSLLSPHQDIVAVAYLQTPIEYGALDEQPVDTLFFLFASDDKQHLHLLAKIAHLSSRPRIREFLKERPEKGKLLAYLRQWEAQLKVPQAVS